MTLPESEFRRRLLVALERIAAALEAANEADPVRAIAAALGAEAQQPLDSRYRDIELLRTMTTEERDQLAAEITSLGRELPGDPLHADLPPAQRRAMGLE